jgi:hypothetical protein
LEEFCAAGWHDHPDAVWQWAKILGARLKMTVAPDAMDDLPEVRDPLGAAIGQIIAHVFAELPIDCVARRAALAATIQCHARVAELLRTPRLN